jgi:hypothetical protein
MFNFFRSLVSKPADHSPHHAIWHRCATPFFSRRMINGDRTEENEKQVWRRRGPNGKWEYQQDPETAEEWTERTWG